MKNIEYFKGKVCTIFTTQINKDLSEKEANFYFLGIIEAVDNEGLLITQLSDNLKSYFFKDKIIGICEEKVIPPDSDEGKKIAAQILDQTTPSKPIDPTEMMALLKKIQSGQ